MTIREMCEAFDVTPRTLRFYESKELLFPIREGQKRLFTKRDRGRLKLILRGKRFGFALEDIRRLLDLYDMSEHKEQQLEQVVGYARKRLAEMTVQHDELGEAIKELKDQIAWGDATLAEQKKNSAA